MMSSITRRLKLSPSESIQPKPRTSSDTHGTPLLLSLPKACGSIRSLAIAKGRREYESASALNIPRPQIIPAIATETSAQCPEICPAAAVHDPVDHASAGTPARIEAPTHAR